MKRTLQLLGIVCILISAHSGHAAKPTGFTSITYDECGGYVIIRFLHGNADGYDEYYMGSNNFLKLSVGSSSTYENIMQLSQGSIGTYYSHPLYGDPDNGITLTGQPGHEFKDFVFTQDVDENEHYVEFKYKLKSSHYGQRLNFRIQGMYYDDDLSGAIVDFTQSIDIGKLGAPTNLSATSDTDCDKVTLNWTNPSISCSNDWKVQVYRESTLIATLNKGTTTYNDLNAEKGVAYNYRVAVQFFPSYGESYTTALSTGMTGKRIGFPAQPTNLSASTDQCDNTIDLSWSWGGIPPANFVIERATDAAFTQNLQTITAPGDKTTYTDASVVKGISYYYRVKAKNACNNIGSASSSSTGIAPEAPAAPSNVMATADPLNNNIVVTWQDNSNVEDGFIINRTLLGGGGTNSYTVDANVTRWEDNSVSNCLTYKYEVLAKNACAPAGVIALNSATAKLVPNLSQTFAAGDLKGSKGYYTNKIDLNWTNDNQNQINTFKIYRRELGDTEAPALVQTLNSTSALWSDNQADAGVMYEYFIEAEGRCENTTLVSNRVSTVGFRSPSGIINGHINYEGGIAVSGVKVLVKASSGSNGSSLGFDGSDDYIAVPHTSKLAPVNAITLSAWIRPASLGNDFVVLEKDPYMLWYKTSTNELIFEVNGQQVKTTAALAAGSYTQVTATYDQANLKLYVNGQEKSSIVYNVPIAAGTSDLYIGSENGSGRFFAGELDELLLFNVARSAADIERDYNRLLNSTEPGLVAYWRLDENVGSNIYDASKTGNIFNKHDGRIYGAAWSSQIPTSDQLGLIGITNAQGDYTISNVRYNGVGENFTLTPSFKTHSFEPSTKVVYIGEGSSVLNGQDFKDNSSFPVTGTVKYKNTTCYVDGAYVKIDGQIVIKNGLPASTDANGFFSINVPIGAHTISVEKVGHKFEVGTWPTNGAPYDFQAPLSGIEFIDNTLVTIVGRVAGGLREANKKPALGRSVNNIGVATFKLTSQQGGGCASYAVTTDAASGEYIVQVPPMKYIVENLAVTSNPAIDFGTLSLLDVAGNLPSQRVVDTVYLDDAHTQIKRIDSARYHFRQDFIYRAAPEMFVAEEDTAKAFHGELEYTLKENGEETGSVDLNGNPFGFPVFVSDKMYKANIVVFERYVNHDGGAEKADKVPVSEGLVTIKNGLATEENVELELNNGIAEYTFKGGQPNILADVVNPQYSFTKTFEVLVEVGPHSIEWLPLTDASNTNVPFRAFVFGGKSIGSSFVTEGPQVVNFILRDPPGSESYAYLAQGKSWSTTESFSLGGSYATAMEGNVSVGSGFTVGIGVSTEVDIEENQSLGINIESTFNSSAEKTSTYTVTESFQTRADASLAGASSDLFVGRSMNMEYGLVEFIYIVPATACNLPGVECFGTASQGFRIGKKKGFFTVPGGYETMFIYDQNHIENYLVPDLKDLRDAYFVNHPEKYTSKLPKSHDLFGTNNDDPVWGSNVSSADPVTTEEPLDWDGPSYTFTPGVRSVDPLLYDIDSVRWYNQQIRLWQQALKVNEEEKAQALKASDLEKRNISFSGGTPFTYELSSTASSTVSASFELNLTEESKTEIIGKVSNTGVTLSNTLTVSMNIGASASGTEENTVTTGYQLYDPDEGDFFSVDVVPSKTGNGPIFITKGGESSCPHEDAVTTKYFEPGQHVLSARTLQREKPKLEVTPAKLINIPADQQAVFRLSLGNESESGDDQYYMLRILDMSNPDGAVLSLDGEDPNREIYVPGGSSINKTLTISKGAVANEYDSIMIVFQSICQYDPTNDDVDIADTVYVSAHFLPSCASVNISKPRNQTIVNNTFNNKVDVVIADYDINYNSLETIRFQYKPSAAVEWVNLETYYRDTVGMNDPALKPIPTNQAYISYSWDIAQLPDGSYDMRAITNCALADENSEVITIKVDRVNPHLFGTPSPGDGILSPNDDIKVQFNETIDAGKLTFSNFDVRGVLNGTDLRHDAFVYFDGTDNDYASAPNGLNLKKRSFTIEFWAKRSSTGEAYVVSQGRNEQEALMVGFDAGNRFFMNLAGKTLSTDAAYTDQAWHHFAASFNALEEEAQLLVDGAVVKTDNSFVAIYESDGPVIIGKRSFTPAYPFSGSVHEVRVWNKSLALSDLIPRMNVMLSGKEMGLMASWPMNEAFGNVAADQARGNDLRIYADWKVEPSGQAASFNGAGNYIAAPGGLLAFNAEMNFTVEFWFKSAQGNNVTLLSNGKGDGGDSNKAGWSIGTDNAGRIRVYHNGLTFNAVDSLFFDNDWHHFALVVNRLGNMNAFVDGNLQNKMSSAAWKDFAGAELCIGGRSWFEGSVPYHDRFFNGKIDEVRIWKLARKQEQLVRDMHNRLSGDEFGLAAYYPFEGYREDAGVAVLEATMKDQVTGATAVTQGAVFSAEVPLIKLQRPISKVNFTYAVNNDAIIITPTDPSGLLENVTLDITVKDIRDMSQNTLQSPVTWIAYIDKNQVVWSDELLQFKKEMDQPLTFEAYVNNQGGEKKDFTISNLPSWLTAYPQSGSVAANSSKKITFVVDAGLNIGEYSQNIHLSTDFGFDEALQLEVKVAKAPPAEWVVDPQLYQYSMNFVAQISINGIISSDDEDMIAAYVGDEIRGVAKLQYVEAYDMHEAFFTVYSNEVSGEDIRFMIWNASEGQVHYDVVPGYEFAANSMEGTPAAPVLFEAVNTVSQQIVLPRGWKWISFNLSSPDMSSVSTILGDVKAGNGDLIKGKDHFDVYDPTFGWSGSLTNNGGLKNESLYKVKLSQADTITYHGVITDPTAAPIGIQPGWNWIGFIPQRNMEIGKALASINPTTGDIVKSQYQFALYDAALGWIGSLSYLKPGEGYMLKAQNSGTLVYPEAATLNNGRLNGATEVAIGEAQWPFDADQYQYSMSVIAALDLHQGRKDVDADQLGVFINGEARGIALPVLNRKTGAYNYFITVFSNSLQDTVEFKVFLNEEQRVVNVRETLMFKDNHVAGALANPVYLTTGTTPSLSIVPEQQVLQVYPNPTSGNLNVDIVLPEDGPVKVEVYNSMGVKVKTLAHGHVPAGSLKIHWDGLDDQGKTLPAGVYLIYTDSQHFREITRIVKK